MNLFTSASLILTPNGYKSGKLYSIVPSDRSGDLTFTRTTSASRFTSNGLIENVLTGVPRLNYSGSNPTWLLEPQRTNTILQSENFNSSSWTKNESTITADSTISPSGIQNADRFTGNSNNISHNITQTNSVVSASNYSFSIYLKKNTNSYAQLTFASTRFSPNAWSNFNLNNGLVGTSGSAASASISDVGEGWYRCTMISTANSTGINNFYVNLTSSPSSSRLEANQISSSIYCWGAQLETGSYPTSYIPTTTTLVTRNADVFTKNNIYTNNYITNAGGTWFMELNNNVPLIRDSAIGIFLDSSIGGFTNGFIIRNNNSLIQRLAIEIRQGGSLVGSYTTLTDTVKIAIKWSASNVANVYVNGVLRITNATFSTKNMEYLNGSATDVPKSIKSMMLFPTPLSDEECILLTQ